MEGKGNDGKGNVVLRDEWQTPSEIFDPLNEQYKFEFDCCANYKNKKCERYSDDFEGIIDINYVCWMNPPFSKAFEMFEHFFKVVEGGVAIYRCDNMETKVWQKLIFPNADWVLIPNRRVNYEGLDGDGVRFPSALAGIGLDIPKDFNGTLLKIHKIGDGK